MENCRGSIEFNKEVEWVYNGNLGKSELGNLIAERLEPEGSWNRVWSLLLTIGAIFSFFVGIEF